MYIEIELGSLVRSKDAQLIKDEIKYLSTLKHPNIIRYIEHFCLKNCVNIIMEYADAGDMHAYIKKYGPSSNTNVVRFLIQLCMGLS